MAKKKSAKYVFMPDRFKGMTESEAIEVMMKEYGYDREYAKQTWKRMNQFPDLLET